MVLQRQILIALISLVAVRPAAADDTSAGADLYAKMCARCHGANGEGNPDEYAAPLFGESSVEQLAATIAETMPEDDPESCVGEDAERVARYIYDAFYSPIAQARIRPPRIELSRLTVRQYENTIADLLRELRDTEMAKPGDERGLEAEYFKGRRPRRDERLIERRDATVDFDFGDSSPDPEKFEAEEFSIGWEGGIIAVETGDYEFIVETENGARLWVNDEETPLVDAWVRSGDQTEYRAMTRLLGGRVYPIRLEFFKFKEPSASIRLKWKPPRHAEQVIPERQLVPDRPRSTFIVQTPFPPDDRSTGYVRATAYTPEFDEATTFAAVEIAEHVVEQLSRYADLRDESGNREEKVREFCVRFVERAFRRPLAEEERAFYVGRHFEDIEESSAVKRVLLLALKSPQFLLREPVQAPFDDFDVASWLSFALWDSLPDDELLSAAAAGRLTSSDEIAAQCRRMLDDPRAHEKVREVLHLWLGTDRFRDLGKDGELYPEFDELLVSDLRTSLDLFLDGVVWNESSDFRQLILADTVPMNERLATFYGADASDEETGFAPVALDGEVRAGVLSHPYMMAGLAYHDSSSPIHRGVFLTRQLLGRTLRPPQEAVTPLPLKLHPELTTRERISQQTSPDACRVCHQTINPLGFSLEDFDAVGRYRDEERGRPIDDRGSYVARDGQAVEFSGARELAQALASDSETHAAFLQRLMSSMINQAPRAFGIERLDALESSFAASEFSIRELLVEMTTMTALAARETAESQATAQAATDENSTTEPAQ